MICPCHDSESGANMKRNEENIMILPVGRFMSKYSQFVIDSVGHTDFGSNFSRIEVS